MKKSFKRFTRTGLVPYCIASRMKKKREVAHVLMIGIIHLYCNMPTNAPTSVNIYMLNLGIEIISIERYTSLSQEKSHKVRKIRICSKFGGRTKDTMCMKSHLMKKWLKVGKLGNLKKMVIIHMFHL